jgi:HD-GYP domain-containing protein (c-di-GMP phosphodiesterase class II)
LELISLTAELAVLELLKSRLHDQAAQQSRRMAAFRRIDLAIKESMDLRVALGVILDQVINHLEVDAADVLVLHPDSVMLESLAQRGFGNERLHINRIRLGQSVPGKIALEKQSKLIPNLGKPEMGTPWENLLVDREFVGYYGVPLVARGSIKGVLEIYNRRPLYPDPEWERFLETLAGQAAIAIDKTELFENWQRSEAALDISNDSTLMTLSKALCLRDDQTEIFTQEMVDRTLQLARSMGVLEDSLSQIRRGVILHDIGKFGIPDEILFKSGPLTDDEWAIMRRHPEFAVEILSPNPQLASAMDIPYCHHERWDGAGYPRGLKEDEIPLAARIFAVIDVWTAMTSKRPYRPPLSEQVTREFIEEGSGSQFDPQVVETFLLIT